MPQACREDDRMTAVLQWLDAPTEMVRASEQAAGPRPTKSEMAPLMSYMKTHLHGHSAPRPSYPRPTTKTSLMGFLMKYLKGSSPSPVKGRAVDVADRKKGRGPIWRKRRRPVRDRGGGVDRPRPIGRYPAQ